MKLPAGLPDTPPQASPPAHDLEAVFSALQRGAGRESVNDGNVDALIGLARERGQTQLEYLLREWRSPCGEDAQAPDLSQVQGLPPR